MVSEIKIESEISIIFKSTAMFTDILNNEHAQIMSAELQQYPNLLLIMQLAMTLPVSSPTCERSFSGMRRVKNDMRSGSTCCRTVSRAYSMPRSHTHPPRRLDYRAVGVHAHPHQTWKPNSPYVVSMCVIVWKRWTKCSCSGACWTEGIGLLMMLVSIVSGLWKKWVTHWWGGWYRLTEYWGS